MTRSPLLDLPAALLREIAHTLGHSSVVVAFAAHDLTASRCALRAGVDDAERSRIPGMSLTIREAEARLRGEFEIDERALVSRDVAGQYLVELVDTVELDDQFSQLEYLHGSLYFATLLVYGADPNLRSTVRDNGCGILHILAQYATPHAVVMAGQLLAAGGDVDLYSGNSSGTALSWAIIPDEAMVATGDAGTAKDRFAFASFLIAQGCRIERQGIYASGWRRDDTEARLDERHYLIAYLDVDPSLGADVVQAATALRAQILGALRRQREAAHAAVARAQASGRGLSSAVWNLMKVQPPWEQLRIIQRMLARYSQLERDHGTGLPPDQVATLERMRQAIESVELRDDAAATEDGD